MPWADVAPAALPARLLPLLLLACAVSSARSAASAVPPGAKAVVQAAAAAAKTARPGGAGVAQPLVLIQRQVRLDPAHLGVAQPAAEQQRLLCFLKERVQLELKPSTLPQLASFSRCAVVSSSGALKARRLGAEIDGHTAVFRFNDAPTKGFEAMVGTKETLRITGRKGFALSGRRPHDGAHYVWVDPEPPARELGGAAFQLQGEPFAQLSSAMRELFAERWWELGLPGVGKSFQPTTGAIGMLLALSLCNVTDAYDMSPSEASRTAPFHYYGLHSKAVGLTADHNSWHRTFEAERELWKRLSVSSPAEVRATGRATIPGLSAVSCAGVGGPVGRIALVSGQDGRLVVVPVALLAACLLAALGYLLALWWQRGLLSHVWQGLRSPASAPAAVALATYLVMLVSLDLLIKHEAEEGHGHYATSPLVIMPLVELGKLLVSAVLYLGRRCGWPRGPGEAPAAALLGAAGAEEGGRRAEWEGALEVAKLMVPVAMLYNVNNLLNFVVLAWVRLDAYAVWRNISILFNAAIWVWALQRRIEPHRWVAVVVCLLGSCFNSLAPDGSISVDAAVSGVLVAALLSSVASVFNERVIKSKAAEPLSIDQVNLLLYAETLSLMFCACVCWRLAKGPATALESPRELLAAVTPGAWRIICVQVALGICVSRVLKYADAVAKTVVGSLRDVAIVFVAPHVVSATRFDCIAVGSACLVGVAGMIYAVPPAAQPVRGAGGGQKEAGPEPPAFLLAVLARRCGRAWGAAGPGRRGAPKAEGGA